MKRFDNYLLVKVVLWSIFFWISFVIPLSLTWNSSYENICPNLSVHIGCVIFLIPNKLIYHSSVLWNFTSVHHRGSSMSGSLVTAKCFKMESDIYNIEDFQWNKAAISSYMYLQSTSTMCFILIYLLRDAQCSPCSQYMWTNSSISFSTHFWSPCISHHSCSGQCFMAAKAMCVKRPPFGWFHIHFAFCFTL